ncbi:hypothetical protein GGTG_11039 [Gaeumannomyces tritici R3-111a-1]|uniref:Levanase n=1 Tax=Gaeumannomyces tritici (strain R3-111a-1) TaxID=644352 RepID=J3PC15_GAET3|nr:hypothetical protein GGTG_11039 [Gaeumannomyces tritici R3-111a-1]EJT71785.1 hypothetical protein GGTG_11039 [Gaeumannomyces tritici R3-111a-1]
MVAVTWADDEPLLHGRTTLHHSIRRRHPSPPCRSRIISCLFNLHGTFPSFPHGTHAHDDDKDEMKAPTVLAALLQLAAAPLVAAQQQQPVPQPLTPEWIRTSAGNSSLFDRWRPRSHFASPHSWMNDPCGAVYEPATDLYHLHYQFHPNHVGWGNVSWGHAVSRDMFHWTDVGGWVDDAAVSLAAGGHPSSELSQFTGTAQPVNIRGERDGTLLAFATGIHHLPTSWKIPYTKGTEVQAMYTSRDGGATWAEVGTVLASPPEGWNVTGWRDPSFFPNADLDAVLGRSEPHYYMVMGSGLKSGDVPRELPESARPGFIGPRIPLYSAPASNLTDWTFLGALWEPAANSSLGAPDITGSYGYNFEVSGFFDLPAGSSGGKPSWFVTMGSEGGQTTRHVREQWALWTRGSLAARANGSAELTPTSGGALDWGLAYAQASFVDARQGNGNRRVMWGWANEDFDFAWGFYIAKALGYAGAITLPTELFLKETRGLARPQGAVAVALDGNEWVAEDGGAFTAQTLGIRPLPDVLEKLRAGAKEEAFDVGVVAAGAPARRVAADLGDSWVLSATLGGDAKAGMVIAQSPDDSEFTTITFDPARSTITVGRGNSSASLPGVFQTYDHEGHFEPYRNTAGAVEDVKFTVVFDRSLLEVFVNDRFALTSRVYPGRADSTGLSFFAGALRLGNGTHGAKCKAGASWTDVKVWKGLAEAWPERPRDTSVALAWDSPEQTGNYTWWVGW